MCQYNPISAKNNISPIEKLFNKIPEYKFLKVFRCSCFPNLRHYKANKFSLTSYNCIFIGYPTNNKGYLCLDLENVRIYISKDVIFQLNIMTLLILTLVQIKQLRQYYLLYVWIIKIMQIHRDHQNLVISLAHMLTQVILFHLLLHVLLFHLHFIHLPLVILPPTI